VGEGEESGLEGAWVERTIDIAEFVSGESAFKERAMGEPFA
jgi:hypothetical protein